MDTVQGNLANFQALQIAKTSAASPMGTSSLVVVWLARARDHLLRTPIYTADTMPEETQSPKVLGKDLFQSTIDSEKSKWVNVVK